LKLKIPGSFDGVLLELFNTRRSILYTVACFVIKSQSSRHISSGNKNTVTQNRYKKGVVLIEILEMSVLIMAGGASIAGGALVVGVRLYLKSQTISSKTCNATRIQDTSSCVE
jgi:hypothetical protein